MPVTSRGVRTRERFGSIRPSKLSSRPTTSIPELDADLTTARMTALRPGASPPPVSTPIRVIDGIRPSVLQSHFVSWAASSVGRAPRSQRGGRELEPPAVHHHALPYTRRLPPRRASDVHPKDIGCSSGG